MIGAPGHGGHGDAQRGRIVVTLSSGGQINITGPDTYSRFGSSCVTADINLDGHLDLVVGAPQSNGKDLAHVVGNYTGAVYVYFGSSAGLHHVPDINITTPDAFTQLGGQLTMLSGLGVAISGVTRSANGPQAGMLAVLVPGKKYSVPTSIPALQLDLVLTVPDKFSWFGASSALLEWHVATTHGLLIVGAPALSTTNGSVGGVYVFSVNASSSAAFQSGSQIHATLVSRINGIEDRATFGAQVAVFDGYVAIAAPSAGRGLVSLETHDAQGNVFIAPVSVLSSLSSGATWTADQIPWTVVLKGAQDFSKLGSVLAVLPHTSGDVLLMSSPQQQHETGLVEAWTLKGGVQWRVSGEATRERYGAQLCTGDFDGDGVLEVAVGSPRRDVGDLQRAGFVELIKPKKR